MPSMRAAPCGRAGERDVQHAGGADVVDEVRVAGQVAAVLDPRDRLADPAPAHLNSHVVGRLLQRAADQRGGQPAPVVRARVQVVAGLDLLRGGARGRLRRLSGREQPLRLAGPHRDVADAAEHHARLAVVGQRDDHGHEREVAVAARELLHRGALSPAPGSARR